MYPQLRNLVELDRETLSIILKIPEFRAAMHDLHVSASSENRKRGLSSNRLDFHSLFDMELKLRSDANRKTTFKRKVFVGALIEGNSGSNQVNRSSYSLLLFKRNCVDSPVLRKLHFDYENPSISHKVEAKPKVHLQMCGKASPHLIDKGFKEFRLCHMYPSIEKPRIPSIPTCLALMLDWLILEFSTDREIKKILEHVQWRDHVVEAEKQVLGPYFASISDYLSGPSHRHSPLIRSMLYGLD